MLNFATNVTWLGFPFNPDTKLTFPRHHVPTKDCANLHPLLHLGGRMFLSTTIMDLQLSSGRLVTAPLAVYCFPCNETFSGIAVSLGTFPVRITVSVPMASCSLLQFTPWASVTTNVSKLSHLVFDILPPEHLNNTILHNLDVTFSATDGQLTRSIDTVNRNIKQIHETPDTLATTWDPFLWLSALSVVSCVFRQMIMATSSHVPTAVNQKRRFRLHLQGTTFRRQMSDSAHLICFTPTTFVLITLHLLVVVINIVTQPFVCLLRGLQKSASTFWSLLQTATEGLLTLSSLEMICPVSSHWPATIQRLLHLGHC